MKHESDSQDTRDGLGQVDAHLPKASAQNHAQEEELDDDERQLLKLFEGKLYFRSQMEIVRAVEDERGHTKNTTIKNLNILVRKGLVVELDSEGKGKAYCLWSKEDLAKAVLDHRGDVDLDQEMRDDIKDILSKMRHLNDEEIEGGRASSYMIEEREKAMLRTCEVLYGQFVGYWTATRGKEREMPRNSPIALYESRLATWRDYKKNRFRYLGEVEPPEKTSLGEWAEYWQFILHWLTPTKKRP